MDELRWLLAVALAALFIGLGAFNWRALLTGRGRRSAGPAVVPLAGGLAGALAAFVAPWPGVDGLWWVAFVVDAGSLPYVIWLGWAVARRRPA